MAYTVHVRPSAERDLARLPRTAAERVAARLRALAADPRPPGATALRGMEGALRIRVGDYRIVYQVDDSDRTVLILRIRHRRDVYRRR